MSESPWLKKGAFALAGRAHQVGPRPASAALAWRRPGAIHNMREQRLKVRFALNRRAWRRLPYHKAAPISYPGGVRPEPEVLFVQFPYLSAALFAGVVGDFEIRFDLVQREPGWFELATRVERRLVE